MAKNLSSVQNYIWLDQKLHLNSAKYNVGGYATINGKIDKTLFQEVIKHLLKANDIFSFSFFEYEGVPKYKLEEKEKFQIEFSNDKNLKQVYDKIDEDFKQPFNFSGTDPLFKIHLFEINPELHIWYCKFHHILFDGYSFRLLFNAANDVFPFLTKNKSNGLDYQKGNFSYQDFINSEAKYKLSEKYKKDKAFWSEKFKSLPELIFLSSKNKTQGGSIEFNLGGRNFQSIIKTCSEEKVSIFQLLLSSFALVVSKFYNRNEITFGIPLINRSNSTNKKTFGPFSSLIPFKLKLDTHLSLFENILILKSELFRHYRHSRFQLGDILKEISFSNTVKRLYDFRFSYEDFTYDQTIFNNPAKITALSNNEEEDPVSIHIMNYGNESLKFKCDFNEDFISVLDIKELMMSYEFFIKNLVSTKNGPIQNAKIASPSQLKSITAISNGELANRDSITFIDCWNSIANKNARKPALISSEVSYTYAEVEKISTNISNYLKKKGVQKGDRLGVSCLKPMNNVIVALSVFKAGGIYVPIDYSFPVNRKKFILSDANLKYILSDNKCNDDHLNDYVEVISPKSFLMEKTDESFQSQKLLQIDDAYIIYTSGTTGNPKGVVIRHSSLYDYIQTFCSYFKLSDSDKVLQQSSLSFDTSIEEIFPILAIGGMLFFASDPKDFNKVFYDCVNYGITLLSTNPYTINYLNENYSRYDLKLKHLISGGDVLKKGHITELTDLFNIYNTYGPTESTVCATYYKISGNEAEIPIGRPITNRSIYVMDGINFLPKGATGEIVISGEGLAKEYLNQKVLTDNQFVEINGYRAYRSGDLGKWGHNNNLIFLGRKDRQLNLRGYRLESNEIESAILNYTSNCNHCYVTIKYINNHPTLVAYLLGKEEINNELKLVLKKNLPNYMVPEHFIVLEKFPLLSNGKIDEKKLPIPGHTKFADQITLPATKEEITVESIWKKLLELEEIDINTSFFELGGHSLLANQFIGILRSEKNIEISLENFYANPTIKGLGKLMSEVSSKNPVVKVSRAPKLKFYPLSFSQERLWFLHHLDKKNTSYHVPRAIKLKGKLEVKSIERTFELLIEKHEILRTVFPVINGVPFQKILKNVDFKLNAFSLLKYEPETRNFKLQQFIEREGSVEFDIHNGPLLKVSLIQISNDEHILVLCEHHLIHDGWTQGILLREFINTYTQLQNNPDFEIIKPELQFKDFAYWQKNYFTDERLEKSLNYWGRKLKDNIPVLPIPLDSERPKVISGNGQLIIKHLPQELSNQLREYSAINDATLFITMLSAFKILLSKLSSEFDITVGSGVANRRLKEFENTLGMVINTLALRTIISDSDTFESVLAKVKKTCFEAFSFEDTPFGKVVEKLKPTRDLGLMPLFQYFFSFMNTPSQNMELPGLDLSILDSYNNSSKFDINVVVVTPLEQARLEGLNSNDERIIIEWEYNSDIFKVSTMNSAIEMYQTILETMVKYPKNHISSIDFLKEKKYQVVKSCLSQIDVTFPKEKTILDLFQEQVFKNPDNIALTFSNKDISYVELDIASSKFANYLIDNYAIDLEEFIGVQLPRSEWIVISILAILKTGGAYVPIDPDSPQQRQDYVVQDSNCKLVIDTSVIQDFEQSSMFYDQDCPEVGLKADNLAYVIYTSGSTGSPKGVLIEHKNVVRLFFNENPTFNFSEKDVWCLFHSFSFDFSVWEIFGAILFGGMLVIIPDEATKNGILFSNIFKDKKISVLNLTPSVFKTLQFELSQNSIANSLRYLIFGGEALFPFIVKDWHNTYPNCKIVNMYGITETTVHVTSKEINNTEIQNNISNIGKPISTLATFILDENQNLIPNGIKGEIYVGGHGLARGYLNQQKLTESRFINVSFQGFPSIKLYRTGDLGRVLESGDIEYLNRSDNQVKVRGYRIELDEIQAKIEEFQSINRAIVIVREINLEKYIVAYCIPKNEVFDSNELKDYLETVLPTYMIPSYFIGIEAIPTTINGKLDYKSLPGIKDLERDTLQKKTPSTDSERKLLNIWKSVLNHQEISVSDNFFEIGGHSLHIMQIISRVNAELGHNLDVLTFFEKPTIEELAFLISSSDINQDRENKSQNDSIVSNPLSFSQERLWLANKLDEGSNYNISSSFTIDGNLDIPALQSAFKKILQRHKILRSVYFKENGGISYKVMNEKDWNIDVQSFHDLDRQNLSDTILNYCKKAFNLEIDYMLRVEVLSLGRNRFVLIVVIHHIAADGWSMSLLVREVLDLYKAITLGKSIPHIKNIPQYSDFSNWQRNQVGSEKWKYKEEYWLRKLKGFEYLDFAQYKIEDDMLSSIKGSAILFDINEKTSKELIAISKQNKKTLFVLILACFKIVLSKLSGTSDICIGSPIAGRTKLEWQSSIGCFLNLLALRTQCDGDMRFDQFLTTVEKTVKEGLAHQEIPFERIVQLINPDRTQQSTPFFQVLFNMLNLPKTNVELDGLSIDNFDSGYIPIRYNITLYAQEINEKVAFKLVYNENMYPFHFMELIKNQLIELFKIVTNNHNRKIADLMLSLSGSKTVKEEDWNNFFD